MALVTANGVAVLEGTIIRPLVGVWTADLKLDQPDGTGFDAGTKVTITSTGGYSLSGVVDTGRTGDFLDSVHVRIVGGADGMGKPATPRSYVQPSAFVRDVVNGLMQDAGQTLSSTTDVGFLGTNVTAWSVLGNSVSWNLRALLKIVAPTFNWRILADGTLWIGTESWPAASGTFDSISQDPADNSYVLGVEAPFVVPGTNISGLGNVNYCMDVIRAGNLRTHVYIDLPNEGDRDDAAAIERMVKQAVAGVDYYAMYVCQVVSQAADLTTVDVTPLGARNKALLGQQGTSRIPVRVASGIKVKFAPGATVLLGWDGGSPAYPFVCCGLSGDTPLGIQIGGTDPVVTKADMTALIQSISLATYVNAVGTPTTLVFVPPTAYGSLTVSAGR